MVRLLPRRRRDAPTQEKATRRVEQRRRVLALLLAGLRWVARRPDVALVLLALLALAITWPTIGVTHRVAVSLWPVLAFMTVIPVLFLRRAPAIGWAATIGSCLVWWLLVPELATSPMPWPVMQFLILLATLLAVAIWAQWYEIGAVVAATGALLWLAMPETLQGWAFGQIGIVVVGLLLRWLVVSRRELAQQTERTETERAQRAVVEERSRIARELHDVVAHHMSMIVVQAQSAPLRLGVDRPEVTKEFTEIEHSAREALGEVRGVLGVLRDERGEAERAPQPGLEQMPPMLEATRAAGMQLTWSLRIHPHECPPGTALVLFRVLQESLANAARHAPGSEVDVLLQRETDDAVLTVRNRAGAAAAPERGGGAGIAGMTARAEAVGGTLSAEPDGGGGFVVRAQVPMAGRPTAGALG